MGVREMRRTGVQWVDLTEDWKYCGHFVLVNNQRDAACFTWFIITLHVSDTVRVHLQE